MFRENVKCVVVITARERFSLTLASLKSLSAQNLAPDVEIIFATDASFPADMASDIEKYYPAVHIVSYPGMALPTHLRKFACDKINSEYAVFLDNDTLLESSCIANLILSHANFRKCVGRAMPG